MMACTSPAFTVRLTPFSISLPATRAVKSEISSKIVLSSTVLTDGSFQAHTEQILRLDREFHRQLLEHDFAEAAHDHVDRVLGGDSPLQAVKQLILANLGSAGLVLDRRSRILHFHVREGVRGAFR